MSRTPPSRVPVGPFRNGARRIDVWVTARGSDARWELPSVFIRPGEDPFQGVLDRIRPQILELTRGMCEPCVELREWPYNYTVGELLALFLIDERDDDVT